MSAVHASYHVVGTTGRIAGIVLPERAAHISGFANRAISHHTLPTERRRTRLIRERPLGRPLFCENEKGFATSEASRRYILPKLPVSDRLPPDLKGTAAADVDRAERRTIPLRKCATMDIRALCSSGCCRAWFDDVIIHAVTFGADTPECKGRPVRPMKG